MLIYRRIQGFYPLHRYDRIKGGDLLITATRGYRKAIREAIRYPDPTSLAGVTHGGHHAALFPLFMWGQLVNEVLAAIPREKKVCILRPLVEDNDWFPAIRNHVLRRYGRDILIDRGDRPGEAPKELSRRLPMNPYHSKPIPL